MRRSASHPELKRLRRLGLLLLSLLAVVSAVAVALLASQVSTVIEGVGRRFGERSATAVSRALCREGLCYLLRAPDGPERATGDRARLLVALERDGLAGGAEGLVLYDAGASPRFRWDRGVVELHDVPRDALDAALAAQRSATWTYVSAMTVGDDEPPTSVRAQATLVPLEHPDHESDGPPLRVGALAVHHDLDQLAAGERRLFWSLLAGVIAIYVAAVAVFTLALSRARRALEARIREAVDARALLAESEKLATIGEIISGVAHELNNPLTTVVAHTELLASRGSDAPDPVSLRTILDAGERCKVVVRRLLDFSRRGTGEARALDVASIVDTTRRLVDHQLRVQGIEFESRVGPGLPRAMGDPDRMGQVLLNLVVNAMQSMADAGVQGVLRVTARGEGGTLVVDVEDEGPGVDPDVADRIFEPFFTTKPQGVGTGLGLPVCLQIVEESGGSLRHLVRPGGGALFRITLPASADGPAAGPPATSPRPAERPARGSRVTPLPGPLDVLVVDDDDAARTTAVEILLAAGAARVFEAAGPDDALRLAASASLDVVVSDLRLEGARDGLELLGQIGRKRPDVGLLLLTGETLDARVLARLDADGVAWLTKPYGVAELVGAVRETLQRAPAGA